MKIYIVDSKTNRFTEYPDKSEFENMFWRDVKLNAPVFTSKGHLVGYFRGNFSGEIYLTTEKSEE